MSRLLIIEHGEHSFACDALDRPRATDAWTLERVTWSNFRYETLHPDSMDGVLAVALDESTRLLDFFKWLRAHPIHQPTLAILPPNPSDELLHITSQTADDFALWPVQPSELHQRIVRMLGERAEGIDAVRDGLSKELGLVNMIGRTAEFQTVVKRIALAARSDCEVLITGETGTGKELCARELHQLSARRNFPFVCIDCGAVPDHLFENELFGHIRGAYTDAHRTQKGLVATAEGGTLFLDEVDGLSYAAQGKLLRFLEDHTYRPLGAEQFCRANVRVLAATNRDLRREVEEKRFRRDLFFRLDVLSVHLPPLRARRDDIAVLAQHFLDACCAELHIRRKRMAPSTLASLREMDWPGNVRELYNVIRRAVVFSDSLGVLPSAVVGQREEATVLPVLDFRAARARAITSFERTYVEDMLRRFGGNITRAAREAGKDRRAFGRLVKRHNIDKRNLD